MSEPAIVCEALTRDFGSRRAVDRLLLEVPAGSVFAFPGAVCGALLEHHGLRTSVLDVVLILLAAARLRRSRLIAG